MYIIIATIICVSLVCLKRYTYQKAKYLRQEGYKFVYYYMKRQFKEMNRKSRLFVSIHDFERLKQENPNADCGILLSQGRKPIIPSARPTPASSSMSQIIPPTQDSGSVDDLPF